MKPENIISLISGVRYKSNEFLRQKIREYGLENLSTSHSALLSVLYHSDGELPMLKLVKKLGRNKSTVTEMVKSAEKGGYVLKIDAPDDKRAIIVQLTEKATAMQNIFDEISDELIQKTYNGFNDVEKVAIINLLEKINNNFS